MSTTIVPLGEEFAVEKIVADADPIIVVARASTRAATCPRCGKLSRRPHSSYTRTLRHTPWGQTPVLVEVTVRRWFCDTPGCPSKIFCERIADLAPPYARRTRSFTEELAQLGWEASGEGASRIARTMGLPASGDTVLRILRATPDPEPSPATVIGIDDWALRKGTRYGTMVVDQERHVILDLLPDREEETVIAWLRAHPEVRVITRDRDGVYASAAAKGAPQARQVADRWHLLANLADVLETVIARLHPQPVVSGGAVATHEPREEGPVPMHKAPGQLHREARFEAVQRLRREGRSTREIAHMLGLSRKTVRKYAKAERCPDFKVRSRRPRVLDPWEGLLSRLWEDGIRNGRQLFETLRARGYRGSAATVRTWAARQRRMEGGGENTTRYRSERQLSSRTLVRAFLQPWAKWPRSWTTPLSSFLADPTLAALWRLTHLFRVMVTKRKGEHLGAWLRSAEASGIPELVRLVRSLRRDFPAVQAALTEPWSQGVVEGLTNKLKFKKRQMFGRASFDLLRKRMLHTA
jgi:transposase